MMPLEKQVPNLDLCKRMKELGFPQDTHFYWVQRQDSKNWMILDSDFDCNDPAFFKDYAGQVFAAPTVSELGEILPDDTRTFRYQSEWVCKNLLKHEKRVTADTEVNAKAKMWIYLRESGLI